MDRQASWKMLCRYHDRPIWVTADQVAASALLPRPFAGAHSIHQPCFDGTGSLRVAQAMTLFGMHFRREVPQVGPESCDVLRRCPMVYPLADLVRLIRFETREHGVLGAFAQKSSVKVNVFDVGVLKQYRRQLIHDVECSLPCVKRHFASLLGT